MCGQDKYLIFSNFKYINLNKWSERFGLMCYSLIFEFYKKVCVTRTDLSTFVVG